MNHEFPIRVRFSELDPFNHVNHAVYLQYFETGRVEALEAIGAPIPWMVDQGFQVVVSEITVSFKIPAVGGDDLTVVTGIEELGRVSSIWTQEIRRGHEVLATARVRVAATDLTGRLRRTPPTILDALEGLRLAGC